MAFSEEQTAQISKHLDNFGPNICPMCNHNQWGLHPDIGALCAQQPNGINMMKALQTIQVVCEQCGFVVTYASDKIGVDIDVKLKSRR